MTKSEFEERITRPITDIDYAILDKVYMWHPSIDTKDQIAYLYENFGMRIIYDMLPSAEKSKDIMTKIDKLERELKKLKAEYTELEKPNM